MMAEPRDAAQGRERRIGALLEREHRGVDRRCLDLAAQKRPQRVVVAARAHPHVAVGIDAELAQRMAGHHPARERVVAVEGDARAAQLRRLRLPRSPARRGDRRGRRRRPRPRAPAPRAAPPRRPRRACGCTADRTRRAVPAGLPTPPGDRRAASPATAPPHAGRPAPTTLGDGLVVRARDLAEEAVNGERWHRRRVAPWVVHHSLTTSSRDRFPKRGAHAYGDMTVRGRAAGRTRVPTAGKEWA